MITIHVDCSHCGRKHPRHHTDGPTEIEIELVSKLTADAIEANLTAKGWIVQRNGDHFDTYCSKSCAK